MTNGVRDLSKLFAALADPTRLAIVGMLVSQELTVLEIASSFEISQPAISRHLKVLEDAGMIERRVEGSKRPCRLIQESIENIEAWMSMMQKGMRQSYDRLDDVLKDM